MLTNQSSKSYAVPCGCRHCGCLCPEHSPDRIERLCAAHVNRAVFRFIADEASRLVVLVLFAGMVAVWAAILGSPGLIPP
jgi:hypothetical protein